MRVAGRVLARVRQCIALLVLGCSWLATSLDAQLVTVTPTNSLAFGTILSGTTTAVDPRGVGAMAFDIHGILGLSGGWSLTLPTNLSRVGGGGAMPVTFCSTCAVYRVANNNPAGGTTFNPNSGVSGLYLVTLLHVYVWIGGSVSPPLNQPPGSYTGTVVLTLAPII